MWLTEEERKRTSPAEKTDFVSPVPTQIVSNGEYNPMPQTAQQKQVEGRIKEMADKYAHRLNMDRRSFLKTSSGMAVAFLAPKQKIGSGWDGAPAGNPGKRMFDGPAQAVEKEILFCHPTHLFPGDPLK